MLLKLDITSEKKVVVDIWSNKDAWPTRNIITYFYHNVLEIIKTIEFKIAGKPSKLYELTTWSYYENKGKSIKLL